VPPVPTLAVAGAIVIELSVGGVPPTVKVAVPLIEPEVAVMVTVPAATPLAIPLPLIVAKAVFDELHVTLLVRFWLLPSLYSPVAANPCVPFTAILAVPGDTEMDVSVFVPPVTVNVPVPVIDPDVAVIVTVPAAIPVATPLLFIVATALFDELQLTVLNVGELPSV
jgi:hypothetical protein